MPLTPALPAPLAKAAKWLIRHADDAAVLLLSQLVDYDSEPSVVADLEWRYLVIRWERPAITGAVEDTAQVGLNIANITGGDLDTSWTTGDYTTCEGYLDEWWTTVKPLYPTGYVLKDYRWYVRRFNDPMTLEQRFAKMGPPQRVTVKGVPGTSASGPNAQQLALSVTLKTPVPRHWGRVYMPPPDISRISTTGRWASGTMTTMANAFAELVDDLQGSDFQPFVPVTQVDKVLLPAMLGITSIQVDDVPDVIRRRRAKTTLARTVGVPTA